MMKAKANLFRFIGSKHRDIKVDRNLFLENLETVIKIKGAQRQSPIICFIYLSKEIKDVSVLLSGEGAMNFWRILRVQKSPFDFHLKFLNQNSVKKIFIIFF